MMTDSYASLILKLIIWILYYYCYYLFVFQICQIGMLSLDVILINLLLYCLAFVAGVMCTKLYFTLWTFNLSSAVVTLATGNVFRRQPFVGLRNIFSLREKYFWTSILVFRVFEYLLRTQLIYLFLVFVIFKFDLYLKSNKRKLF